MDADVVPGSVTDWTVTIDDQRRLKRAMVGLRLRGPAFWLDTLGMALLLAGLVWASAQELAPEAIGDAFVIATALTLGLLGMALLALMLLLTVCGRVEREYPAGATLTAWVTDGGMGVRTLSRLAFYPWSRLTQVTVGPVLARCRQEGPRTVAAPLYLPAGPDELSRSVDFPVQLIGPEIRRELLARAGRTSAEPPMAGEPVVIDQALRLRLIRSWLRAEVGIVAWALPVLFSINAASQFAFGSYVMATFLAVMTLLNPAAWLLAAHGRMSGMYPANTRVVGSVGEWIEVQGPWGSVAWHHGWLKMRRTTEHTVTYEVLRPGPDGTPMSPDNVEKRIVVIPRAFLDTPTPTAAEV
ncbi:hypothetical protein G5C66_21115 [Nocardioides sp. KC13]|uniref:Uncharacterized protein n=1 Tax=Nocardioides turkmenicus TaxID=2711220 RepID=A0A6M1QZ00_9ACTN|nr:hypothetical protein [Nocardioides sp. KC13]NGN95225.1 hypothetical protein [Nocardioides sp. KC13]